MHKEGDAGQHMSLHAELTPAGDGLHAELRREGLLVHRPDCAPLGSGLHFPPGKGLVGFMEVQGGVMGSRVRGIGVGQRGMTGAAPTVACSAWPRGGMGTGRMGAWEQRIRPTST